jgi:small subunit ribosomal protein S6
LSPVEAEFRPVEGVTTPEREVDGYEYEIMYIVEPGCEKEAVQEVADRARQIIEQGEGALDNVRTSQLRRLAFEIKGKRDGTYVVLNLRSRPAVTRELDRLFKLDERVLRHMILRTDS